MSVEDIAVIGAGSYGTCLAVLFGKAGHRVNLYCRGEDAARAMDAARENTTYLPGHPLPPTVTVTADLEAAVVGGLDRFVRPPQYAGRRRHVTRGGADGVTRERGERCGVDALAAHVADGQHRR